MNAELPIDEKKDEKWLSPVEAAEYSGLSKPRMYQMIKDMVVVTKEIPESERDHRGAHVLVLKDSVDTYLANRDKPREKVSGTTTKYIPRSPPINIDDEELREILNVSLKDLIYAYKERRIDRTVYTVRDAAKATGIRLDIINALIKGGYLSHIIEDGRVYITEQGMKDLKERFSSQKASDDDIVTI